MATWAETRGSVWCGTLGKKGLRNRCRHLMLFAALRKCGNNRLLAKGAGFQRLISGVQHSPPCLHSQTFSLVCYFVFSSPSSRSFYSEVLSCRAATGRSSLCAHLPFSPFPRKRLATVPTETGLPSPPVAPSGASPSQTNVARPLTPDSSAHCQRKKGFLVSKCSRTGLHTVTNSLRGVLSGDLPSE